MKLLLVTLCIIRFVYANVIYNDTNNYINREIYLSNVINYCDSCQLSVTLKYEPANAAHNWCPTVNIRNNVSNISLLSRHTYNDTIVYHLDTMSGEYSLIINNCDYSMSGKNISIIIDTNVQSYTVFPDILIWICIVYAATIFSDILIWIFIVLAVIVCVLYTMKEDSITEKNVYIPSASYYDSYSRDEYMLRSYKYNSHHGI